MSKLKRENKKHNIHTHINISRTHRSHYSTKTPLARAPMTFYAQVQWLLSALYLCSYRTGFCFWIPSFREESTALASSVLSSLMLLLSSLFAFRVLTRVSLTTCLLIAWLWPSSLLSQQTLRGWLQWCPIPMALTTTSVLTTTKIYISNSNFLSRVPHPHTQQFAGDLPQDFKSKTLKLISCKMPLPPVALFWLVEALSSQKPVQSTWNLTPMAPSINISNNLHRHQQQPP